MVDEDRGVASLRIVQLADDPATGYCGRLLATLGAEVLLIEPPCGDGYRRLPTGPEEINDPDAGLLHLFLDASKRSTCVRRDDPAQASRLEELLVGSDVVLCSADGPDLARRLPDVVVASLTPLGLSGPDAEVATSTIGLQARSGWMYQVGEPGGEPLQLPGELPVAVVAGTWETIAVLAALRWRDAGGRGQLVEVSVLEALLASTRYFETTYALEGQVVGRTGSALYPYYGYLEAKDGFVAPCAVTERHVRLLAGLMGVDGVPEEGDIRAWLAAHPKEESFHLGQRAGIPWGFLATATETLELAQLNHRRAFTTVEGPSGTTLRVPDPVRHLSLSGGGVRAAPRLGQHGLPGPRQPSAPAGAAASPAPALPLSGLRVIDLTSWWAGPMANLILAQLGAEVIKVESIQRPDAWRTLLVDESSATPWETSSLFLGVQRDKQSVTLDLTHARGRELLVALVATADVLIENLQPKVLRSLGLDYATFSCANPGLVMLSQSGFGQHGPWADYSSLAQVSESLAGLGLLTGRPGEAPVIAGQFIGDTLSATHAAVAVLAALTERDRTGRGQHIDLSQLETTLPVVTDSLLGAQLGAPEQGRTGNRHVFTAPQGCYPTRTEEEWVVLSVADDGEWARLAALLDADLGGDLVGDAGLACVTGRRQKRDELDATLLVWCVAQERNALVERCRAAGLRADPVQSPADVLGDPHLVARHFYCELDHVVVGRLPYSGLGFRLHATPLRSQRSAPLLGEHNASVLGGLLGLPEAELADLEAAHVIGTHPR